LRERRRRAAPRGAIREAWMSLGEDRAVSPQTV
jgi:hypothetical protein